MRFRFIGNGDNDPSELVLAGVKFPKGQAIPVEDADLINHLRGHSHFEAVKGRPQKNAED